MKIAIIFYSFSNNTRALVRFLKGSIGKHEVELVDLKLQKEEKSFFGQCRDARKKITPALEGFSFNAAAADMIIFASPVWAFTFAPALRSALTQTESLQNKKAAAILTCGSGLGTKKALQELENVLKQKGAEVVFSGFVSGSKCTKIDYLTERLQGLLKMII